MADKEIKVGLEEVKLEALKFFLKENNTTVEAVLKEHLDKVYEKQVPQQVRKFVERNMNVQAEGQENSTAVQEPAAPQPRRRRGQNAARNNHQTAERVEVQAPEEEAVQHAEEDQGQEIAMVM